MAGQDYRQKAINKVKEALQGAVNGTANLLKKRLKILESGKEVYCINANKNTVPDCKKIIHPGRLSVKPTTNTCTECSTEKPVNHSASMAVSSKPTGEFIAIYSS